MHNHNSESRFVWVLNFVSVLYSETSIDWGCLREGFKEIICA
jgi:hypothetical protein